MLSQRALLITLIVCATVAGIVAGTMHVSRNDSEMSPYSAVRGTNPTRWLSPEREALNWREADLTDCHQSTQHFHQTKQYLTWEDKVGFFADCMKGKGYGFDAGIKLKETVNLSGVLIQSVDGITERDALLLPETRDGRNQGR
jgi:hypothetical protein